MAGTITSASHPRLLVGDISHLFGMHYAQHKPIAEMVYKKKSSQRNFEEAVQLSNIGEMEEKAESAAIVLDSFSQGHARLTTHKVWTKAVKISMEAVDDNRHLNMSTEIPRIIARSKWHTVESQGSALFNNATSTSAPYLGADGKALLASDHGLVKGGSVSNLSSSDLSELAIENARIAIDDFRDNANLRMNAQIKCLLIPSNSQFLAERVVNSPARVGTADNDLNAIDKLGTIPKILKWNFLTDTNSWFLLTDQPGLCYYERMAAKPFYYQEDNTFDHVYGMKCRFSFDYFDWRSVYGSMGAS